jgi:DNA-binding XRE family transcriptional regulator
MLNLELQNLARGMEKDTYNLKEKQRFYESCILAFAIFKIFTTEFSNVQINLN